MITSILSTTKREKELPTNPADNTIEDIGPDGHKMLCVRLK
jgi:hypothetical protein